MCHVLAEDNDFQHESRSFGNQLSEEIMLGRELDHDPGRCDRIMSHPSRRPSYLVCQRAIGQRLREMDARNTLRTLQMGDGARDPQHAVIGPRAQPHWSATSASSAPLRVRPRSPPGDRPRHWRSRGRPSRAKRPPGWRGPARHARRPRGCLRSAAAGIRSAAVTGGTSMCRSIRSISGPEIRPW